MESGEISARPASLDPPGPFSYTIGNYFEFADNKTGKRITFTKFYFIGTLEFEEEDTLSGVYK